MTSYIYTTNKTAILVDDEWFPYLNRYRWHVNNSGLVVRARHTSDPAHYPKNLINAAREICGLYEPDVDAERKVRVYYCDGNKLNLTANNLKLYSKNISQHLEMRRARRHYRREVVEKTVIPNYLNHFVE